MSLRVISIALPGARCSRCWKKLNRENITLIVVTHDPDIAGRTARQIHIVDGRIDRDIATRRVHEGG